MQGAALTSAGMCRIMRWAARSPWRAPSAAVHRSAGRLTTAATRAATMFNAARQVGAPSASTCSPAARPPCPCSRWLD